MIVGGIAVAVGVAAWAVRPFVVMARRGTLDQQRLAAIRAEVARLDAQRAAQAPDIPPDIPSPRAAPDAATTHPVVEN